MVLNIPPEVSQYFFKTHGQILLVKGNSGTGKSTFSLEIPQALGENQKAVVVFPRMDRHEIYASFNLARSLELKGTIKIFDRSDRISDANRFEKEFIDICKSSDTKDLFFIIDTIDSIIEKYDNPHRKVKELIEIFQTRDINTILIQEDAEDSYIDNLVGGIVTLNKDLHDERRVRTLTINKLRGIEIKNPQYLMTLRDGRCKTFGDFSHDSAKPMKWNPLQDPLNFFSTGIRDLDAILGGGYRKGSYNVIDIADNVSINQYMPIMMAPMLNFLSQKRGVVLVTPGGEHPESVRSQFVQYIEPPIFDKYMRIADYFSAESNKPYVLALGTTKEKAIKTWTESIAALRGAENKPILDFTGLDTVEYQRGETIALRELINGVAATKITNDLGIGLIKPGLKLTQGIKNVADTYFKLVNLFGYPCIYGVKPRTEIYCISYIQQGNESKISLTPLV